MGANLLFYVKPVALPPEPDPEQTYTQYSEAGDGYVGGYPPGNGWDLSRDAVNGDEGTDSGDYSDRFTGVKNESTVAEDPADTVNGTFNIWRSHFEFDLTDVPNTNRTITDVKLHLFGYDSGNGYPSSDVMVQQSTFDGTTDGDNKSSFTGPGLLDSVFTWDNTDNNVMTLNAAGIAYIQSVLGSSAKLCLREGTHDWADVAPTAPAFGEFTGPINGAYFIERGQDDWPNLRTPKIVITYEKEEVWTSIFDNTKWESGGGGSWNAGQNRWETSGGGDIYLDAIGTWADGYRPSKIRVTWQFVGAPGTMEVGLFVDGNSPAPGSGWDSLVDPEENNYGWVITTGSLQELPIFGDNHRDMYELNPYVWPFTSEFYITNIEFLEP